MQSPARYPRWMALLAAGCLLAGALAPTLPTRSQADSVESLLARQRENARAREQARAKLRAVERQRRVAGQQLHEAERRVGAARNRLAAYQQRLSAARRERDAAAASLRLAEARLARHEQTLSQRLAVMCQHSNVSLLDLLARSTSFSDFSNRAYLMRLLVDADLAVLEQVAQQRDRVARYREQAQRKTVTVSALTEQTAQQHRNYVNETARKTQLVKSLDAEKRVIRAQLAELERNSRELEALIQRSQRTPEGRARHAQPWKGSLLRPVAGPITSGFGMRFHPILHENRMHTGIDIGAPPGTPIKAADAGVVILSGRHGGYGLRVVVDHGGGVSTVYAHCSSLLVKAGQNVSKGQVIARVGSTGLATGPHLHFEVRRDGRPVNPLSF